MGRRNVKSAVEGKVIRRKGVRKKVDVNEMTAGEILHKQNLAVYLRIATYTNSQIASALGVTRGTVRNWFKEPRVVKLYEEALESLSASAKEFLETLTIEAVKRLGELMRDADHKIALDAVREILDRGGIPKLSRVEKDEKHTHSGDQTKTVVHEIRMTNREDADRYEALIAEAEELTAKAAVEEAS